MHVQVYPIRVKGPSIINYCYVVHQQTTNEVVLIDPAWELPALEEVLVRHTPFVRAILLTHSHNDHVNLAHTLAQKYDCPVWMTRIEAEYYGFTCHNLSLLDDETPRRMGSVWVQPVFTPGHTAGGTCFLIDGNLFSGDTLFIEGCGVCTGVGADPQKMYDSLQKLKQRAWPDMRVFPGHSYGLPPGQPFQTVQKHNLYLQIDKADVFIKFRMRKEQSSTLKYR